MVRKSGGEGKGGGRKRASARRKEGKGRGGDHRVSINYLKKILDFMSNMKHDC